MGTEREWKFLVTSMSAAEQRRLFASPFSEIVQGYLSLEAPVVRVRRRAGVGSLTVKWPIQGEAQGPRVSGELEYEIPDADAKLLVDQSLAVVRKTRYLYRGMEVDVFQDALEGLIVAECEVSAEDPRPKVPAGWTWNDVSADAHYVNVALAVHGIPVRAPDPNE